MNRVIGAALLAVTVSSMVVVPPAEANPFSWFTHTGGSMLNRVEHGVLGGVLIVGGLGLAVGGLIFAPIGFGIPAFIGGVLVSGWGVNLLANSIANREACNPVQLWTQPGSLATPCPAAAGSRPPASGGSNLPRTATALKQQSVSIAPTAGTAAGGPIGQTR